MIRTELTHTDAMVLVYIQKHPYTDAETMSEQLGIKLGFIKRTLDKMSDEERIVWTPNPDSPIQGTHQSDSTVWGWILND